MYDHNLMPSQRRKKTESIMLNSAKNVDRNTKKNTIHPSDSPHNPLVGIIMGSDSDLPVMQECSKILEELDVSFELRIVSAHRTPNWMVEYAESALGRGLKVIVCGAGGAAHLPGMVASITPLPVIGVPICGPRNTIGGMDSLYSIVQMPPGIPVATMAINGSKNAGILACSILSTLDPKFLSNVQNLKEKMRREVEMKNKRLIDIGYLNYLNRSE